MPELDPALEIPEDDDLQDAEPQQLNPAKVGPRSCTALDNAFFSSHIMCLIGSRKDSIVLGYFRSAKHISSFLSHVITLSASLLSGLDTHYAHDLILNTTFYSFYDIYTSIQNYGKP